MVLSDDFFFPVIPVRGQFNPPSIRRKMRAQMKEVSYPD